MSVKAEAATVAGSSLELVLARIAIAVLLVSAVLWVDRTQIRERTDFSVTYIGSRMVALGMGAKLYDINEQQKLKASLLPHAEPLIFEHPPFEAILLSPLGALPYKTAYLIWGLLNAAIWLYLPSLLRPYSHVPKDELAFLALWIFFAPLWVALFQGQSSILLLLLYTLTFIQIRQERYFRAGLILGLGLIKFQFVIPFTLIFALRRKWNFVQGFVITGAALGLVSVVGIGWNGGMSYIHLLINVAGHADNFRFGSAADMATLQGLAQTVLGRILPAVAVSALVGILSLALLAWVARRWEKLEGSGESTCDDLMFAAAVVASLVTGFHMFTHDLSPMMLALLLGLAAPVQRGTLRIVLRCLFVLFWIPFLYFALVAWHVMYLLAGVLLIFCAALVCSAVRLSTEGRAGIRTAGAQ